MATVKRHPFACAGVSDTAAISVENLSVCFGPVIALSNVTVRVPAGCLTAIVGPPGCGKSVLMKSLTCEIEWGSGSIWIQDVPARLWPPKKRDACLCAYPATGPNCPSYAQPGCERLREALQLLGLAHLGHRHGSSLTERDRRRLDLACTIAGFLTGSGDRRVHLWLDDALDGLDSLHQHRLMQWLRHTAPARQTTVVTVTDHGIARLYAEHVILLARGAVVSEGSPESALHAQRLTQAFGDGV